ncbi:hypothetical protein PAF17_11625 [Paracoccus sp. Z330]|uniref:Uncharacterized protein n=1 Tax=Paracoccus onchidii TaxID=3017813 RepID=A0ABT4ZFQ1_9RHOB|nr:hypothetical protein [Paracoccus onchidii]MDB6178146.1 hypothetical protein [Paracoccus onchidii]
MCAQKISHLDNVVAALQQWGAQTGGAKNEPFCSALRIMQEADEGRSGQGFPLPGPDRPTWAAYRLLERENRLLIDHAEMMACALGACPNCWGTIPDCEDCGGIGKPGTFAPDKKCFDQFVLPVIARVMGHRVSDGILPMQ